MLCISSALHPTLPLPLCPAVCPVPCMLCAVLCSLKTDFNNFAGGNGPRGALVRGYNYFWWVQGWEGGADLRVL